MMPRRWYMSLLACGLSVVEACGGAPTGPSGPPPPPPLSVSGTFVGSASDSTGLGEVTWNITQSQNNLTGPLTFTDTRSGVAGTGTGSGTLSGTTLSFTWSVPKGGMPAPLADCAIVANGSASEVTSITISGNYSGNNSCSGAFSNGYFTLRKQ